MSLRQYIYKPQDIGRESWPPGELRLEGITITDDPNSADLFVCPGNIRIFETTSGSGVLDIEKLNRLPYFKGNEAKHAFLDCSDNFRTPINLPILFLRCDTRSWMLPHDTGTINFAWPVEDYKDCVELPADGFKYDVSFQGWISSLVRKVSVDSCVRTEGIKKDIAAYKDFYGHLPADSHELHRRRAEFKRSMKESRVILCPESIEGVFPYRYFEAMSAGRVPLLVGSDFVFPLGIDDKIQYTAFTLMCPRFDADKAGEIALNFVKTHTDEEIIGMGKVAREAWEKYLDARKWPELFTYALKKKLCPIAV